MQNWKKPFSPVMNREEIRNALSKYKNIREINDKETYLVNLKYGKINDVYMLVKYRNEFRTYNMTCVKSIKNDLEGLINQ